VAASQAHVEDILRLPSINGNANKAFELLTTVQDCLNGVLHDYNPDTKLVGAVNRENVTCYLDSLLFSMFARTDSFEGVLTADYHDPERRKLVVLLRLWVNMLRTGKLITTDIVGTMFVLCRARTDDSAQTEKLQESLRDCGWPEAALLRQQDVSEAFTFITGKLDLPLLTLKMDVYHTGKEDKDDHRIVRERLLDVAIPKAPEDGSVIRLEDCLESYFNHKIEVKRLLQRRNTLQSLRSMSMDKGQVLQMESIELRPGSPSSMNAHSFPESFLATSRPNMSPRADSIFSHRRIGTGEPSEYKTHDDISIRGPQRRASTIRREVLMPAWQFFSLIRKSIASAFGLLD
jgi:Ubiquitin carboxyl-terminal hydrolase